MTNRTYDILNKIQRWLYSLGVLYLALASIWDLPYGDAINKTIAAIGTFLASVLEISTVAYKQRQLDAFDISAALDVPEEEEEEEEGGIG